MLEADPRLACIGTDGRLQGSHSTEERRLAEARLPIEEEVRPRHLGAIVGADDLRPRPAPRERGETALLLAEIRNAEMAIRGFCELAAEQIVPEGEALHGIANALGILSRARSQAETVLAPWGRGGGSRARQGA